MADRKPHLRIVSDETPDKGMRADVSLDHKFRARRTGQSPVEYANAIEGFKRQVTTKTKLGYLIAAALVAGAFWMWRS